VREVVWDCRRTFTVSKGYSTNLPRTPAVEPKAISLNASMPWLWTAVGVDVDGRVGDPDCSLSRVAVGLSCGAAAIKERDWRMSEVSCRETVIVGSW
jgi:hypothetical protein